MRGAGPKFYVNHTENKRTLKQNLTLLILLVEYHIFLTENRVHVAAKDPVIEFSMDLQD